MKRMWNKLRRGEKGQALIIVVVLMLLGSLIIAPLLGYMGTGLIVGQVHEERMMELYAADAGVEDGLWYLQDIERLKSLIQQRDPTYVPPGDWGGWTLADYDWPLPSYNLGDDINGKGVAVTIDYLADDKAFKITSVATSDDSGTTIVSYLPMLSFDLLQNAVTSLNTITLKPGVVINGTQEEYYTGDWPTKEQLSAYYLPSSNPSTPYLNPTIDVKDTHTIGPLYRDGDLTIINTNKTGSVGDPINTITLDDTIYVTGKLIIGKTNQDFTLNLNGKTIFVNDASTEPEEAIHIGDKCTITGSGCIIAVGDIYFEPKTNTKLGDFVFVMSIDGKVRFQPKGDFYGSVAGDVIVELWPKGTFTWNDPSGKDLNFLGSSLTNWILNIDTWEISLQQED